MDAEEIIQALDRLFQAREAYSEARMYRWYERYKEATELEEAWAEIAKLLRETNEHGTG